MKAYWSVLPVFSMIIFSCSDSPQGKFTSNGKDSADPVNDNVKFIHNDPSTVWMSDWSTENTVVYHWRGEPDNLHPTNGKSNPRRVVMDYTQRFLVSTDLETQGIRPDLLVKLPEASPDGLTYSFELRSEPTWDDGTPLSADDVEFSIKAFISPYTDDGFARPYFETISGFEKDPSNPRKFRIHYARKYIQNVALFADLVIMEKKYHDPKGILDHYSVAQLHDTSFVHSDDPKLKAWSTTFNDVKYGKDLSLLNGLGAYKVIAWENKQRLELTRKPNHWTSRVTNPNMYDRALPQKIIFKVIGDDNAILLGMKNQTIDVSTWINTHGLTELRKDSVFNRNYHSAYVPNYDYQYIGMNMKPKATNRTPFFDNVFVRRAMAFLVDIDAINEAYLDGKAVRFTGPVSPMKTDVYNTQLKPVKFSLDSAKKLLDAAGWKDTDGDNVRDKMIDGKKVPFDFEILIISGNPITENIASDTKDNLYKAGVKATVRSLEFVTFYEQVQLHHFDMYLGAWSSSSGPEDYKQIWGSGSWEQGSNYVGYGDAASDALIERIRTEIVDSVRIPLEKQLQKMIFEQQPYIFLFSNPRKIAIHRRFDHADMYYDKPGVFLSNLLLLSPGNMPKPSAP